MKLPEKAPNWQDLIRNLPPNAFQIVSALEVQKLIQKANAEYVHWENLKRWPFPEKLNPDIFWTFVKMQRFTNMKFLPLMDQKGDLFSFWLPNRILQEIHTIDRESPKSIISEGMPLANTKERYIQSSLMEEAIASSQIEGAATTREVAKQMLREGRKPRDRSEQMILNNYAAMNTIRQMLKTPLSLVELNRLHQILTENTLDHPDAVGRLRTSQDNITVDDPRDNTTLFVPPAADTLPQRLEVLFKFANNDDSHGFIHPVVKAMILHFWLAYEHPYVDGNGRTARALFYWYMLKSGYWLFEFISISRVLLRAPAQYARAFLYSEHDDNDMTYFLTFNARAIRVALKELNIYLHEKQREFQQATELLKRWPHLNLRQHLLLTEALRKPAKIFTIETHAKECRVVYQTARTDLMNLANQGLFKMVKSGRRYSFFPIDDLPQKLDAAKS